MGSRKDKGKVTIKGVVQNNNQPKLDELFEQLEDVFESIKN